MRFSTRIPSNLEPNRLARALETYRRSGRPLIDLTVSNPTQVGIEYPRDLLASLGSSRALVYAPHALGIRAARVAVAADYARRGVDIRPERIALTASTSEAYSCLFKLLTEPGDEVLVPRPSYPLFEHLTGLDAVVPKPYDLDYHGRWTIDTDALRSQIGPRTRALLLVSPNNPTGSFVSDAELDTLSALCASNDLAMIADEVFADYPLPDTSRRRPRSAIDDARALTFALGGLSKSVGLPQVKVGWIAAGGESSTVDEALARLELVCDTYLSVSTPAQLAVAQLLSHGEVVRRRIQQRVSRNYDSLRAAAARAPSSNVLEAEGGWYAVIRVPAVVGEEDLVLRLLEEDGVLVHPGYFFDFRQEAFLVVSLLPPADSFDEGITRLLARAAPALHGGRP